MSAHKPLEGVKVVELASFGSADSRKNDGRNGSRCDPCGKHSR